MGTTIAITTCVVGAALISAPALPATAAAVAATPPPTRSAVTFSGELSAGQGFDRDFADGLRFALVPQRFGWEIVIRRKGRDENLARLTPPFHFVPNPRDIEGWHFRNADNTGPNEAGDRNVNAPGEVREFVFSPEVGATIDGPDATRSPTPAEIERVLQWGLGTLTILEYRLADLDPGKTARFEWMRFSVQLSWPPAPPPTPAP